MESSQSGPGNILDRIVEKKREEIALSKFEIPLFKLEQSEFFTRECFSLRDSILNPARTGIIAEFNRRNREKLR